jgi:hypothetical protein
MRSFPEYEEERAEDLCDPAAIVHAFLQHKYMKQMEDYLARGRRFANRSSLAHKLAQKNE